MGAPRRSLGVLFVLLALTAQASAQTPVDDEQAISEVLGRLHQAAAAADFDRYFGLYADEAIFLGTDATERWTRADFMAYAKPYFDQGRGWTYTMTERNIFVSHDGNTAWFDERLDNQFLGECRGSGALVKADGEWKVVQYNLTIPIPNALATEVVEQIREHSVALPSQ